MVVLILSGMSGTLVMYSLASISNSSLSYIVAPAGQSGFDGIILIA